LHLLSDRFNNSDNITLQAKCQYFATNSWCESSCGISNASSWFLSPCGISNKSSRVVSPCGISNKSSRVLSPDGISNKCSRVLSAFGNENSRVLQNLSNLRLFSMHSRDLSWQFPKFHSEYKHQAIFETCCQKELEIKNYV
jgi:hypothetical protein